jgi:hypothetical protein
LDSPDVKELQRRLPESIMRKATEWSVDPSHLKPFHEAHHAFRCVRLSLSLSLSLALASITSVSICCPSAQIFFFLCEGLSMLLQRRYDDALRLFYRAHGRNALLQAHVALHKQPLITHFVELALVVRSFLSSIDGGLLIGTDTE